MAEKASACSSRTSCLKPHQTLFHGFDSDVNSFEQAVSPAVSPERHRSN